jgi:hypothetical protein
MEIGWFPVPIFVGTVTFTWYSPTNPGASPANWTGAGCPPIVTVTALAVWEYIVDDAGSPLAG